MNAGENPSSKSPSAASAPITTVPGPRQPGTVYIPKHDDVQKILELITHELDSAAKHQRSATVYLRRAVSEPGAANICFKYGINAAEAARSHLQRASAWMRWTIDPSRLPDTDV